MFCDELFGVERNRITRAASSLRELIQQRDGSFIGDENVEPPTAVGIGFQAVPEGMVVLAQFTAQPVAVSVRRSLFTSPRLCRRSPVIRRAMMGIRRRNADGMEIGEQCGGQRREIGDHVGI